MIALVALTALIVVLDVCVTTRLCKQHEQRGYRRGWADAYASHAILFPREQDADGKVWPHPRPTHSSEAAQQGCEPPRHFTAGDGQIDGPFGGEGF